MISSFMLAAILLAFVNMGMTGVLLVIYHRIMVRARSSFTLSLTVFAGAFLLQNGFAATSYILLLPAIPEDMAPLLFGIGAFEAAGLAAALWTASR